MPSLAHVHRGIKIPHIGPAAYTPPQPNKAKRTWVQLGNSVSVCVSVCICDVEPDIQVYYEESRERERERERERGELGLAADYLILSVTYTDNEIT